MRAARGQAATVSFVHAVVVDICGQSRKSFVARQLSEMSRLRDLRFGKASELALERSAREFWGLDGGRCGYRLSSKRHTCAKQYAVAVKSLCLEGVYLLCCGFHKKLCIS